MRSIGLFIAFLGLLLLSACAPSPPPPPADIGMMFPSANGQLAQLGHTIQVGAFSQLDNAVRLERTLQEQGLDAYYFRHSSGLYKVRFGDHANYAAARSQAEQLRRQGVIRDFFIVLPGQERSARGEWGQQQTLRQELVSTARGFLGVPYRWGGENRTQGFDCSGLTMVSYRLNGFKLPRNSRAQYQAGRSISRAELRPGDLVFFATQGGRRVSHVGLYIGAERFIHAPRPGRTVREASLSSTYFRRTFVGARSYL